MNDELNAGLILWPCFQLPSQDATGILLSHDTAALVSQKGLGKGSENERRGADRWGGEFERGGEVWKGDEFRVRQQGCQARGELVAAVVGWDGAGGAA